MGPISNRCRVKGPGFGGIRLRLTGNGMFAIITGGLSGRGECVHTIGLGNGSCRRDFVARRRVLSNTALRLRVYGSSKRV